MSEYVKKSEWEIRVDRSAVYFHRSVSADIQHERKKIS